MILLKSIKSLPRIGGVLDTSFNLHGQPMVCSPEDAVFTFENSGLDILVMNKIAILRKGENHGRSKKRIDKRSKH